MGRKLTLTGVTIADAQAPKLITVDPIESIGSLFLVDPTHPASTMGSGVPTNGQPVTNLLNAQAMAIVGADVPGAWVIPSPSGFNGVKGRLERTTKGGIHSVPSPTLADSSVDGYIRAATPLEEYVRLNPGHAFYLSIWKRVTKAQTVGPTPGSRPGFSAKISKFTSPSANVLVGLSSQDAPALGVRRPSSLQPVGPFLQNGAASAWQAGAPPAQGDIVVQPLVLSPGRSMNYTDAMSREQEGRIVYRAYIEDLTVSGRTYAQVDAIDYALYTKEVLTPGGRYYGDTWTDPTTLA